MQTERKSYTHRDTHYIMLIAKKKGKEKSESSIYREVVKQITSRVENTI